MWAILRKDLLLELRTKEGISSLFTLALLVLLVFQLSLPGTVTPEAASAAFWIAFVLAGSLGVQRSFALERENRCLDGLSTAPVSASDIFVAKTLANVVTLGVVQGVSIILVMVFFGVNVSGAVGGLIAVLVLGNVGFAPLATLFSAMTANLRAREVMLPLVLLPLLTPLLIGVVSATTIAFGGGDPERWGVWIQVLVAFDTIASVAAWLLFESLVRDV